MSGIGQVKDEFNEADIGLFKEEIVVLSGASDSGSEALSPADTWVQVPGTVPTAPYLLVVSKENSDGTIRFSTTNLSAPSAAFGNKMASVTHKWQLDAGEVVYYASSVDGDDVNWTTKVI